MGTLTIRPEGIITDNANITKGFQAPASNPASKQAAISDASDNTWVTTNTSFVGDVYSLADPAIPAGRYPVGITAYMRYKTQRGIEFSLVDASGTIIGSGVLAAHVLWDGGVKEEDSGQQRTKQTGGNWTAADLNAMRASIYFDAPDDFQPGPGYVLDIWVMVEYTDVPAAPTGVAPAAGSTIATDVPTLTATIPASPNTNVKTKAEWQLATDSAFTANVRTITEADADLILGPHSASESVPNALQLLQGTWYVRCRAIDEYGTQGTWSPAQQFTVSHPPTTTNQSPTGDTSVAYASGTITLSWAFSDPSPVDTQTALQVVVERNDTGASVLDTGKVASTTPSRDVVIPAAQKDQPLRWKVRVWDSDDVVGAYSSNQLFRVRDLPTVTATGPTGVVNNPTPPASWTFAASGGRTQTAYRVVYEIDNGGASFTVVDDTGWVTSSSTSYQPGGSLFSNGQSGRVTVYVRDSSGLENNDTDTFTVSFTPPDAPPFAVDPDGYDTLGSNRVTWRGNLLTYNQGSLETNTAGWTAGANASIARSTAQAADGVASLAVTATAAGDASADTSGALFPVVPGFTYKFRVARRADATARTVSTVIRWRDAAGAVISQVAGTPVADSAGGFATVSTATATAPANAVQADIIAKVFAAGAGEVHYIDAIGVYLGADSAFFNNDAGSLGWRVYRRAVGESSWELLAELPVTTMHFDDYLAAANTGHEYAVVQIADRFGVVVESAYNPAGCTPSGTNYWLIFPDDPSYNVLLPSVTAEQYDEEFEEGMLLVIGRGRKRDRGTRWGYRGTATAQIWDDAASNVTAREKKRALEAIRNVTGDVYLRNPFGDVWKVVLKDLSISRLAGVGQREFVTATIPYEQVA